MKKTDFILLSLGGVLILTLWLTYLTKRVWLAIILAVAIWGCAAVSITHFVGRRKKKREMPLSEMEETLALLSNERICEKALSLFPSACNAEIKGDYLIYTDAGITKALFPIFKFGAISGDDIAKVNRTSQAVGAKSVTIAGKLPSRPVLLLAAKLKTPITFIGTSEVRRILIKHNLMPKSARSKPKKSSFKEWKERGKRSFSNIFVRRRARLFLLSGCSLAFVSIFSPLKIYYVAMATLSFLLMAICLINDYRKN